MRITMQNLFLNFLLIMTATVRAYSMPAHEHQGPQLCGGILEHPHGVIQTPNFPNPFPVPIKCRWIIKSNITGSILIFFTQQYTTSGLTFTEYMYYEGAYKEGKRTALTVTEENITTVKYLRVTSPILVIELTLNRLEGTQLRSLGLLSMYGFNITYAVVPLKKTIQEPSSCTAIECRLLGHCYVSQNYEEFSCSCFEGYSGDDCGVGPLCPQTPNMCKNGGTCRQLGPAAVGCICAPGYTGDLCEAEATPECGVEECSENCAQGSTCDCNPKSTDVSIARFETQLVITEQTNLNISQELVKKMKKYLRDLKIAVEEINVIDISEEDAKNGKVVKLRLWAPRKEAKDLRLAVERLIVARALDRLRLMPSVLVFDVQPGLNLHALMVNQRTDVWEGSEFMLSCIAYGSPDLDFIWYKDGVKINFNGTTREIWTRTVAEDPLGRRMSVLGVSEAKRLDSGKWSCSAVDAGRRRCRALRISVLKPPDIRLVPSSLTVQKGENISITCLAGAGRVHGALGFSWAREKLLLPQAPGKEVWEDLYPAGSILKLYNLQKSGEYRCQVSSVAGTNAKSVTVWALGANDVACPVEASHGLRWPRTAPGAHATALCPAGQTGETTRFCEPKTSHIGVKWMLPDFSGCVADTLKDIYEQFTRISYGYSWGSVSEVIRQYASILRSQPAHPGQGTIPLKHCREILKYLLSPASNTKDRLNSADHLLQIFDNLLMHPDSFMDEENIYDLQEAVVQSASMKENIDARYNEYVLATKPIKEHNEAHMNFQPLSSDKTEWIVSSVGIELIDQSEASTAVAVLYHNLAERLPSLRRSIYLINGLTINWSPSDYRSGQETEYLLASHQVQLFASGNVDTTLHHTVTLLFTHVNNYSAIVSKLQCGLRTSQKPNTWNTDHCSVKIPEPSHVACTCRGGLGTFALFTVARSTLTEEEKDLRGVVKITVGLGGAMCLVAAALQLLAITPGNSKLPVLLKVATAGSHSAAMLSLLECDTRQDEACPGALGWICAACWCAGCAALCAQPLLLQAELAGRTQRSSSVGLVAGVCTLAWLTARLWGGAPLHIGSAAQIVCAAGCFLLTVLCFALTICANIRLRIITHKVPAERKNYLDQRNKIVYHTLILLVTTSAVQITGIAYAQPGARRLTDVGALSAAALANGLAMIICYVIREDDCLQGARRVFSLSSQKDWHRSITRDTSLNLYIKQSREVENRGGVRMLESSSSPVSPVTSFWRASALESPALHRRQSTPDSRADIVRCVEHRPSISSPSYDGRTTVCDLISHAPLVDHDPRVCLQLSSLNPSVPEHRSPLLSYSIHYEPYAHERFNMSSETCNICVQSNPDISRIPSPPVKSCLKKPKPEFASSTSLPSIKVIKDDPKTKSDIEQVNREWNKAYNSPDSDKVLNKISNDLDFLLNRTAEKTSIEDQIEEAPL